MYIAVYYFLAVVGLGLVLAAAVGKGKASLNLLIPAGAIFLLITAIFLQTGVKVQTAEIEEDLDANTTEITYQYEDVFDNRDVANKGYVSLVFAAIGVILVLLGSVWRFY